MLTLLLYAEYSVLCNLALHHAAPGHSPLLGNLPYFWLFRDVLWLTRIRIQAAQYPLSLQIQHQHFGSLLCNPASAQVNSVLWACSSPELVGCIHRDHSLNFQELDTVLTTWGYLDGPMMAFKQLKVLKQLSDPLKMTPYTCLAMLFAEH